MIGYASRTGSTENLALLRRAGWRLLVSASGVLRTEGFPYALDNGAWTDFQKGRPFDEARYLTAVEKLGADADWIVLPDVVADHHASLRMAEAWLPKMDAHRVLIAVQDGAVPDDVRAWLGPRCGIFIGGRPVSRADRARGTHDWKERSARTWGALGKGARVHGAHGTREQRAPDRHLRGGRRALFRRDERHEVRAPQPCGPRSSRPTAGPRPMKPRRKKVQTTAYLDAEQVEALAQHRQSGRPTAVMIREGHRSRARKARAADPER